MQFLNKGESSGFFFYLLEDHDKVGQEVCEFLLVRRLIEMIKDLIYEGIFVWKSRMDQHQQLCGLFWSQQL